jgi:uncharacterized protein (TIGR03083 family)
VTGPWEMIHAARRSLAADLAGLSHEQWRHVSLCPAWDVEHVVAHLGGYGRLPG